jgi:hypothetical protein
LKCAGGFRISLSDALSLLPCRSGLKVPVALCSASDFDGLPFMLFVNFSIHSFLPVRVRG